MSTKTLTRSALLPADELLADLRAHITHWQDQELDALRRGKEVQAAVARAKAHVLEEWVRRLETRLEQA